VHGSDCPEVAGPEPQDTGVKDGTGSVKLRKLAENEDRDLERFDGNESDNLQNPMNRFEGGVFPTVF
jgi:hypothetical protein